MSTHKSSKVERLVLAVLLLREAHRAKESSADFAKRLDVMCEEAKEMMTERALTEWRRRPQ